MATIRKTSPIGIDKVVDMLQTRLEALGWSNYEIYPRAYKNESADGIVPEVYGTNGEYDKDVLFDDTFDATSFFLSDDNLEVQDFGQQINGSLSIIFQVKLDKIKSSITTHRPDEEVRYDVILKLKENPYTWEVNNVVTGIANVYEGLAFDKSIYNDMSKYHVFRVNMSGTYAADCALVPTATPVVPPVTQQITFVTDQSILTQVGITLTFASTLTVDWGDGSATENFVTDVELTHDYGSTGSYTISITGDIDKVTKIKADNSKINSSIISETGILTELDLNGNLITGTLDLTNVTVNGSLFIQDNTGITGIAFSLNTNSINFFRAFNCDLTGVLDLSNVCISGTFQAEDNASLTDITFATSGNALVTSLRLNSCDLTGTLNLSNVPISTSVTLFTNPNLTGINFSTTGNGQVTSFRANGCDLTGVLNLVNLPIASMFQVHSNANLTGIVHSASGNSAVTSYLARDCALTTLDLSSVPIATVFDVKNNTSMTSLILSNASNGVITDVDLQNCDLPNIDFSAFSTSNGVDIQLFDNAMTATEVDDQLIALNALGWTGCTYGLAGDNAARTSASDAAFTNLTTTLSCTVTVN